MKIDFGDVFASGLGWLLKQIALFVASIWLGCTMGAAALLASGIVRSGWVFDAELLLYSPQLLLTIWIIPNVCFLGASMYWFVRNETNTPLACGIIISVEALVSLAGKATWLSWLPQSIAWVTCVALIIMMATGLWFLRQWQLNRWAMELEELKAENAMQRAQLKEQFGTDSAGVDETGIP